MEVDTLISPGHGVALVRFGSVTVWGWNGSSCSGFWAVSGGVEEGHTQEHTHTQERTRKCCTYPLATYPLKSARNLEVVFVCLSTVWQRGRFRFRFLENGSGGSGSTFGSWENGSDCSGFRFRFGPWATLHIV